MSIQDTWERLTKNIKIALFVRRFLSERSLSPEATRELQIRKLRDILVYAKNHYDFYRRRFLEARFVPEQLRNLDDMQKIPILTKNAYRQFTEEELKKTPRRFDEWYHDGTSGSTGSPLKVFRTWDERAYMSAKWMRALYRNGYKWNDITFSLPSPHRLQKDSIAQKFGLMMRYSVAYTEPVEKMVEEYLKRKPSVFYANKSQIVQMAMHCLEHQIDLPQPRFYVCAAETLDENSKLLIQSVFGSNLSEVYGAVEFNNIAWRELGDSFFHFSHNTNILELEDKSGNIVAEEGYCVITDLYIRSFPLIRYQLGDYLETEMRDGKRVIKKIRGRLDDWVIFADGTRKPFHPFYEIMERRSEVLQFRIIQETHHLIRVIVRPASDADRDKLEAILLNDLKKEVRDGDVEYKIEWVDEIPPDPNGKLRMLISKVSA